MQRKGSKAKIARDICLALGLLWLTAACQMLNTPTPLNAETPSAPSRQVYQGRRFCPPR